mgnify:FL=1
MSRTHDVPQRSPEWFALRAGAVTGSRAGVMLSTTRSGAEPRGKAKLRVELALERLQGANLEPTYQNADMLHGVTYEPYARTAYAVDQMVHVEEVGYVQHPTLEYVGCSPDGLVGTQGCLEIKAPAVHTHAEVLRKRAIPADKMPQLIHTLFCTGRSWIDFCSFHPHFPDNAQLFIKRLGRDEVDFQEYQQHLEVFLEDVQAQVTAIQEWRANEP